MASSLDEEWYDFLDRYIPFEVNSRRPKSLKKELRKLVPIIPDMTRTGPRDMESFKLYLREVIFNHVILWEETLVLTESEYDSSVISIMLRIMDYLSLPCHTNEDYHWELMKRQGKIAQLQEEIKELKAENLKLSKQTKQPLFKSSYTKVMNVLHRSHERNQVTSSTKAAEENESKTKQLLRDISKSSIKEVNPKFEDEVVRKVHACSSGSTSRNDPCPCAERVVKKLSCIIKTELMCVICRDVITKPILLQCGHMFCETCLDHWNEVKLACPYCRSKIQCNVEVPIDSFMVEMFKLILSNCNMRRSRLIKPSEPTKNLLSSILKTSDTRTLRRSFIRRPDRSEVSLAEENIRN